MLGDDCAYESCFLKHCLSAHVATFVVLLNDGALKLWVYEIQERLWSLFP